MQNARWKFPKHVFDDVMTKKIVLFFMFMGSCIFIYDDHSAHYPVDNQHTSIQDPPKHCTETVRDKKKESRITEYDSKLHT